jgi:molybdopterin molybdotransferase
MAHISFEESIHLVNENLPTKKRVKKVGLEEALGYVLAEDIVANFNNPSFPTASMDGYAIKHSDIDKEIKIIGSNPAGSFEFDSLKEGEAIKTFTGSFVPNGADTLVPIENVEVKDNILKVITKVNKNFSVREVGEDFKKGEILIKKGTKITFAEIGVMASLNIPIVEVVDKAKVAVIATGSEILDLGETGNIAQIHSSNNYTLSSLGRFLGYDVTNVGLVKDNKKEIQNKILNALEVNDIVVTTGGVSVGDFDFVKEIVSDFEIIFHGVNIKPGQWVMIGKFGEKYIISLPGFPYSSFVTFLLYVVPFADKISGLNSLSTIKAKLRDNFKKVNPKTQFVAVNISFENGEFFVDTRGKKSGSSGILTNITNNFALMKLDTGFYELDKNSEVEVRIYNKDFL